MKTFNSSNLDMLRRDLKAALAAVEARHDIKINIGNMRYNDTSVTAKVECLAIGNADAGSHEEANYNANIRRLGLPANSFGATFRIPSEAGSYTISKLKTKNHKYPVIATNNRGQNYKFSVRQINRYMS